MSIKVQHGLSSIPENETTIIVELEKAVNLNRAFIITTGSIYGRTTENYYYNSPGYWNTRLVLLDSKHIEVKRAYPSIYEAEVAWQVIEEIDDENKTVEPEPEKEIDWTKVPVDTPVMIKDDERDSWGKRFFAFYVTVDVKSRFCTWINGNTSQSTEDFISWRFCELAPEVDPTPYYKN